MTFDFCLTLNTWMSICPKDKTESSYQQLKPKLWKQPRISNNLWALKSTPIVKIRIDLESVSNFAYAISWCSSKSKVWITLIRAYRLEVCPKLNKAYMMYVYYSEVQSILIFKYSPLEKSMHSRLFLCTVM